MADELTPKSNAWGQFGTQLGGDVLSAGLGLLTQNLQNRNNYKWGEKAAQSDFDRQMQLYERQYQDKSPLNIVNQLKAAGLNKGLMFSGGAGGVGGAASGTTAATNKMSNAHVQERQNLAITMAQMENIRAQTELTKAQKAKTDAETLKTGEEVTTIKGVRDVTIEEIKQRGESQWIDNSRKKYENWFGKNADELEGGGYTNEIYGSMMIHQNSIFTESQTSQILKTLADKGSSEANAALTNEKAKGYWQELMNATATANAATIQAAAQKLASEFKFGEEANWKWWVEQGQQAAGTILNGIGKFTPTRVAKQIAK